MSSYVHMTDVVMLGFIMGFVMGLVGSLLFASDATFLGQEKRVE